MPINISSCPLCGSQQRSPLYSSSNLSYVMCDECTFVFLSPRLTEEEYREFYRDSYQKDRHKVTNYKEAIARLKRKGSVERRRKYLSDIGPYLSQKARVLEIGSSWGALLKLIHDTYRADVTGIEISKLASDVAKKYYGIPTFHQTFDEYNRKNHEGAFDVIIMNHVLEHILNPEQTLLNVKNLLTENGVLFVAVPNIAYPTESLDRFFSL